MVFIYDLNGKILEELLITARGNGISTKIDAGKFTSGLYLYSLIVDGRVVGVKRMMLTK